MIITMTPGVGFLAPCYVLTTCVFLSLLHVKLFGTEAVVLLRTSNWSSFFLAEDIYDFKSMYNISVRISEIGHCFSEYDDTFILSNI